MKTGKPILDALLDASESFAQPAPGGTRPEAGEHTALPWEASMDGAIGDIYAQHAPQGRKLPAQTFGPDAEANARLIVRSVNHAERLAHALMGLDMAHNHETLCRAKERARAALDAYESEGK